MGSATTTSTAVAFNEFIGAPIVNGTFEFFEIGRFFLDDRVMRLALVDGHMNVVDVALL